MNHIFVINHYQGIFGFEDYTLSIISNISLIITQINLNFFYVSTYVQCLF